MKTQPWWAANIVRALDLQCGDSMEATDMMAQVSTAPLLVTFVQGTLKEGIRSHEVVCK